MIFHNGGLFMPGRHVTDQEMRLFMTLKQTHTVPLAAAKAGISQATGYPVSSRPNTSITEEDATRPASP